MPDFDHLSRSRSFRLLLGIGLAMLAALIITIVYTSLDASDPASRPPTGASPPQGQPMKPAS